MSDLFVGDVHIFPRTEFSQPTSDGLSTHLHCIIDSFGEICWLVEKTKGLSSVSFLGDIFHTIGQVDTQSLHVAELCFSRLIVQCEASGVELRILIGNHDLPMLSHPEIHSLAFLRRYCVETPRVVVDAKNKRTLFYLPYVDDYKALAKRIDKFWDKDDYEGDVVLVSHADIVGMKYAGAKLATKGLLLETLSRFKAVVNGHHHVPSKVENVTNLGSLVARSFSDTEGEFPRGFLLLQNDGKLKRIPNPYTRIFTVATVELKKHLTALGKRKDLDRVHLRIDYAEKFKDDAVAFLEKTAGGKVKPLRIVAQSSDVADVDLDFDPTANVKAYVAEQDTDLKKVRILKEANAVLAKVVEAHDERSKHRVQINSVTLKNFLSFGSAELRIPPKGLWLVEGVNQDSVSASSNGSGKTTLFEAIYYALTGKILRGLTGNDIIHEDEKFCSVSLDVSVDGQGYQIFRSRNHPEFGTTARFAVVGEDLDKDDISTRSMDDTQELIYDTLGIRKDTLDQVIFLTDGLANRFTGLTDPAKKAFIESLVDVEVYGVAHVEAKERGKKIDNDATELRGSVATLESLVESVTAQRDAAKTEVSITAKSLEPRKVELGAELVTIGERQVTALESSTRAETSLDAVKLLSRQLKEAYGELIELHNATYSKRADIDAELKAARSRVAHFEALLRNGVCPTCEGSIEKVSTKDTITAAEAEVTRLEGALAKFVTKLSGIVEQRDAKKAELDVADNKRDSAESRLRGFQKEVADFGRRQSTVEAELANQALRIEKLEGQVEGFVTQLAGLGKKVAATKNKIDKLVEDQRYADFVTALFAPTGLRSVVLDKVVDFINERLLDYSGTLLSNNIVQLSSKTSKKGGGSSSKLSVVSERNYAKCSSGEKRRIDFAIQMGLHDLAVAASGVNVSLLVCDEIVDTLDDVGMQAVHAVLEEKAESNAVYMVSHNPYLRSFVPDRLLITKSNGYSTIIETE